MKLLNRFFVLAAIVCVAGGFSSSVLAQDAEEEAIRNRMLERVDDVDSLKLSGKVGENNVGFLEQRGPLSPDQTKVMNAENADRRSLYTALAKRIGLTTTVVGRGRAEELRKKSAPSVWLQDEDGKWFKKE